MSPDLSRRVARAVQLLPKDQARFLVEALDNARRFEDLPQRVRDLIERAERKNRG